MSAFLPKVSILDTASGRYMVWTTRESSSQQLFQLGYIGHDTIEISKVIIRSAVHKHVLDIGANLGAYTIPLATAFADSVTVSSFEPQRHVFHQLCGNLFLNQLKNVKTFNIALGNIDSHIEMPEIDYETCWNVGGVSVLNEIYAARGDFPKDSIIGSSLVEMRRVDSLAGIPPAGLVKIDVEGCEKEVIEGMQEYLKLSGYPAIIFEAWGFKWFAEKKASLFEFLKSSGYLFISDEFEHGNFLAQHKDSIHPVIVIEKKPEDSFKTYTLPPGSIQTAFQ